jgi:hypothetical protein
MGFDLKSTNAKLIVGGALVLIVVLLLWPKFRGSTNKYEDDYLETEMFEDEYASEDEYEEGYSEQWKFADEAFEGEEDEYEEGYGPMDNTFGTLAPLAAQQKAIASSRPDLPGVNVATDLLPKPSLSQTDFAEYAPQALGAQNFVDATSFVGVNTQGSSLKNANYQLRADIPIPRVDVGPWANSTIESGDLSRKPLE